MTVPKPEEKGAAAPKAVSGPGRGREESLASKKQKGAAPPPQGGRTVLPDQDEGSTHASPRQKAAILAPVSTVELEPPALYVSTLLPLPHSPPLPSSALTSCLSRIHPPLLDTNAPTSR
jgi:hypothetical protein